MIPLMRESAAALRNVSQTSGTVIGVCASKKGRGISGDDFSGRSPSSFKSRVDPSPTGTGRSANEPANRTMAKIRIRAVNPDSTIPTTSPMRKFFMMARGPQPRDDSTTETFRYLVALVLCKAPTSARIVRVEIKGKTVIVTGAGGNGSGSAIARRLAHEGAAVVVSDLDDAGGRETVQRIETAGGRAAYCGTDMRAREQVRKLIDFAEKTFGRLGLLVNNASALPHGEGGLDDWVDSVQTDLLGTMYATKFAVDAMRRSGGGAIVNISSISALWHGRKHPGGFPGYDAAKAGVIRFTTMCAPLV